MSLRSQAGLVRGVLTCTALCSLACSGLFVGMLSYREYDPGRTAPWLAFDGDPNTATVEPDSSIAIRLVGPTTVSRVDLDVGAAGTFTVTMEDADYNEVSATAEATAPGRISVATDWEEVDYLWVTSAGVPVREIEVWGQGPAPVPGEGAEYRRDGGGGEGVADAPLRPERLVEPWRFPTGAGSWFTL